MKYTLLFVSLLLSFISNAQTKTWKGTSTRLWPSQATNSVVIDSSGTNALTVNNTRTFVPFVNIPVFTVQQQGTNKLQVDGHGSIYVGDGGYPYHSVNHPFIGILGQSAYVSDGIADIEIESTDDINVGSIGHSMRLHTSTNEVDTYFEISKYGFGNGVYFAPFIASGTPFRFNASSTDLTDPVMFVKWQGTNVFQVLTNGSITTGDPGAGAGAWKLGTTVTGVTVALVTTNYVEVSIGGTIVKLAIVQ